MTNLTNAGKRKRRPDNVTSNCTPSRKRTKRISPKENLPVDTTFMFGTQNIDYRGLTEPLCIMERNIGGQSMKFDSLMHKKLNNLPVKSKLLKPLEFEPDSRFPLGMTFKEETMRVESPTKPKPFRTRMDSLLDAALSPRTPETAGLEVITPRTTAAAVKDLGEHNFAPDKQMLSKFEFIESQCEYCNLPLNRKTPCSGNGHCSRCLMYLTKKGKLVPRRDRGFFCEYAGCNYEEISATENLNGKRKNVRNRSLSVSTTLPCTLICRACQQYETNHGKLVPKPQRKLRSSVVDSADVSSKGFCEWWGCQAELPKQKYIDEDYRHLLSTSVKSRLVICENCYKHEQKFGELPVKMDLLKDCGTVTSTKPPTLHKKFDDLLPGRSRRNLTAPRKKAQTVDEPQPASPSKLPYMEHLLPSDDDVAYTPDLLDTQQDDNLDFYPSLLVNHNAVTPTKLMRAGLGSLKITFSCDPRPFWNALQQFILNHDPNAHLENIYPFAPPPVFAP